MLGLNLVYSFDSNLNFSQSKEHQSTHTAPPMPHHQYKVLHQQKNSVLACFIHPGYPIATFNNDKYSIALEGQIYGKSSETVQAELTRLSDLIFSQDDNANKTLSDWLLNADGEFLVILINKHTHEVAIFNDALARLPVYIYNSNNKFIISRYLRFITDLLGDIEFDRMALAQYLIFSHTVGQRSFIKNIAFLQPASLIHLDARNKSVKINQTYKFNHDNKIHQSNSLKQNARQLTSLFANACKNRNDPEKHNILSLSGGLDSRCVGAGFKYAKVPFTATSYLDLAQTAKVDVKFARQLAEIFNIDWHLYQTDPFTGKRISQLLHAKNGSASLNAVFYLHYYEQIINDFGNSINFFTGDGGDRVIPDIRPGRPFSNTEELIECILHTKPVFPPEISAALTGVSQQDITNELMSHLSTYSEKNFAQKYVHFIIHERSANRFFHGEDRNRLFFWGTTPFFAIDVFKYAMNCPNEQKADLRLYAKLLSNLSPKAAKLPNGNTGMSITSTKYRLACWKYKMERKQTPIKKIRRLFRNPPLNQKPLRSWHHHKNLLSCLHDQIHGSDVVKNYISESVAEDVLRHNQNYKNDALMRLFTINSLLENLLLPKSSLDKYQDHDFGFYDY
ncbi:MAG: hypothetical protein JXD22_11925 [Sedimentisphaerales bacterium]|nr:hypothetical protein [Sedimentisphaerales bacterium]